MVGFTGESEHRTGVYMEIHEDSSTASTKKSSIGVEFRKGFNLAGLNIGIIMDGNNRWATANNSSTKEGHMKGAVRAKEIISHIAENKARSLTLYTFSEQNWQRPEAEIKTLLELFHYYLVNNFDEFMQYKAKINFIGRINKFPKNIQDLMLKWQESSDHNSEFILNMAVSYGGQEEILDAVNKLNGTKTNITIHDINNHLYCPEVNALDILIRTGGDNRISNFMLWQAAYAEIFIHHKFWPDFTKEDFNDIILEFNNIERRYGTRQSTK